jgi:hypothetical protein
MNMTGFPCQLTLDSPYAQDKPSKPNLMPPSRLRKFVVFVLQAWRSLRRVAVHPGSKHEVNPRTRSRRERVHQDRTVR